MFIKIFEDICKEDVSLAGGKGASLGEMTQAGISVPPGFVILATAFDDFLQKTDIGIEIDAILKTVDPAAMHTVENASEKIQALILHAIMPEKIKEGIVKHFDLLGASFVAVRSSATAEDSSAAAWAGQLDTFLNTTKEHLLENVQRCWASLFTPRAIFYRFEKGLHDSVISVAVVIQKMVQSEVAGIAFSVHPVTQDYNQLIIEAGWGLGEAVVSGQITPDSYVIKKDDWSLLDINVSEQERQIVRKKNGGGDDWVEVSLEKRNTQKLSGSQIIDLAKLVVHIETHYGFPCDIEWAMEDKKFFITQSRPITTLMESPPKNSREVIPDEKKKFKFVRDYTRDFSIIMEHAWSKGVINVYNKILQTEMPSPIPCIYFINKGVIEVWDNTETFLTLKNLLFVHNTNYPEFIFSVLSSFRQKLTYVQQMRKNGGVIVDNEQFHLFLEMVFEAIEEWLIFDYTAKHSNTSEEVRNACYEVRAMDTLWDDADSIIRKTFAQRYPDRMPYENTILLEEVDNPPVREELERRFSHFIFIPDTYRAIQTLDILPLSYPEFELVFPKGEIINGHSFKGEMVYGTGIKIGRVRIIRRKDELFHFQDGEVLVSPMTTPDFIGAMKKAVVVVTDEGGITCHAAVVARELKISCLIGTQIATEFLKDGDLVEVDAEKGIVKLVEHS